MTEIAPVHMIAAEAEDTGAAAIVSAAAVLPQWRLVWRRLTRHRMAMVGLVVTILIYLIAIFDGFVAPYSSARYSSTHTYAPPQALHLSFDRGFEVYVHPLKSARDPQTFERTWTIDEGKRVDLGLFVRGEKYSLLGWTSDIHLFGAADPRFTTPIFLLGSNKDGRDVFSLIIHGTRVSMSIGLIGVLMAFVLGALLGGLSGYFGGPFDTFIQRVVELFMSIPTLPLWMGLAAAVPPHIGPLQRYFLITIILSGIAWTNLARVVRGRFLSLREEDMVLAARLDGAREMRLIGRHMLPSMASHLIASLTLSIPGMILAETSLSFLGLGLQPPVVSWGVLLEDAQNIRVLETAPWLLLPGVAVVIAVLSLNFLGDGLRDAADPYAA
jgi:peptide/nickel transport system permease protein